MRKRGREDYWLGAMGENLLDVLVRCDSEAPPVDSFSGFGANCLRGREMSGRGVCDSRVGSSPDFPTSCQRFVINSFPLVVMKNPGRFRG